MELGVGEGGSGCVLGVCRVWLHEGVVRMHGRSWEVQERVRAADYLKGGYGGNGVLQIS